MPPSSPPDVNYWYDKRCARAYWSQGDLGPYRELYRHTADWLDPAPGEHWLDLGCGMGRLTRLLWEKSDLALSSSVSLDCAAANADALAALRAELAVPADRLRFLHADFSPGLGSFADASFDGAVSGLAIQYAQHWSAERGEWTTEAYDHLLAEVCRVLKPGGRFVFSVNVPNPNWLRVALGSFFDLFRARKPLKFLRDTLRMTRYSAWLKREAARGRFHYLSSATVQAKLLAAGFRAIEHRRSFAGQAYVFRARKPG
jgi:ubiquinone/menaquinone biosynthesis C-methylase UbiE